jgi:solute carrier family 1 (high affinity glutamate transporter) protein 1
MSNPEEQSDDPTPNSGFTILLAMVAGLFWGLFSRSFLGGEVYVGFLGLIFKAMLKMLIVPLVLASIVTGITSLGDVRQLGRLGARTLGYYALTTGLAVCLGLSLVNTIRPGQGGGAETLQVSLEVNQGKHKRLLALAKSDAEAGRVESARAMYVLFLERYGSQVEPGLRDQVTRERDRIQPPPAYRRKLRLVEAQTRWRVETGKNSSSMTVKDFLLAQIGKLFKNPFQALANTDILAIIVFALLLGGCLTTLGEQGRPLIAVFESLNAAMMVLTNLIMTYVAPVGVFALMADVVASLGIQVLQLLGSYMACVVLGLGIHGLVILPTILRLFGGMGLLHFLAGARKPMAVALSTASSSATLPVTIEAAEEQLGCLPRTAGFVLPLGATVNMDGTALYEAVAALFIAQIYGIHLSLGHQVLVALTATLAAIGAAGIPSAGTVTMVMVLNAAHLPLDGIALILAVDRVLDMCRTMVNVMGDLVVAVVVDRGERRSLEVSASDK